MKKLYAIITAALLLCGCTENDNPVTETAVGGSEVVTEKTVITTAVENTSMSETTTEEIVETVTIAGQEFPIDTESVTLYISDIENITDVSGLGKLYNLRYLDLVRFTDGNTPYITGFNALENCDTITDISIQVGFENYEEIYILETLPNLTSLSIAGADAYDFWNFNLNTIEHLSLVGTTDLTKIEHLTNLKSLYIEYSSSTDLTPIEKLENLESLQIWESRFADYSSILELENLKELYICSTPMTREMYDNLVENLPDCKITVVNLEE